ncbi:hypothetical protein PTTG_09579 [Puccinia triticina 1-1 BBBD Race 1]|uniref:Myb_DNA-bind_3 domain-containing protein n=1 Tax=Puccinia triticina (isolate 1-1 / race 1 (BBBD)) TaxID=630390 RepID=A0A180G9L8_PUCT1|nr:hypothetical protein PTTG_09579 [Puccinia triticina 1-1 BBBD Race 1]
MARPQSSQPTYQAKPLKLHVTPKRAGQARKEKNSQASLATPATPSNQTQQSSQATGTNSQSQNNQTQIEDSPEKNKTKNLIWTAGMERSALKMYVKAVESGKQGEAGFKPEVHQSVAIKLAKEFPGVEFTVGKAKSKFNQTFKKVWDAFLACKGASGFGWNEAECMFTASEDAWNSFLVSHPNAKQFKNTPFPEYSDYQVIFEGNTASGVLRCTSGNKTINACAEAVPSGDDVNSAEDLENGNQPTQTTQTQRLGVCPPRQHQVTSGNRFESSIDCLAEAFLAS